MDPEDKNSESVFGQLLRGLLGIFSGFLIMILISYQQNLYNYNYFIFGLTMMSSFGIYSYWISVLVPRITKKIFAPKYKKDSKKKKK